MARKAAKAETSKASVIALDAYTKLVRATESSTSRIHRHLNDADLTISQFGVLEALYHLGPLCQKDLAEKILKTSGNLTMVIENLEKRSLVIRERDQSDRRSLHISLTDRGRKMIAQLFPKHAEIVSREMSILSAAEQATLARLCQKLGLQIAT